MSNNSAPLFDRYADMDFSEAKPVPEIPASAQLKAEHADKSRITMRIDNAHCYFSKPAPRCVAAAIKP